jgi:hypothetical protein
LLAARRCGVAPTVIEPANILLAILFVLVFA